MKTHLLFAGVCATLVVQSALCAQSSSMNTTQAQLAQARQLIESGAYRQAEEMYSGVLAQPTGLQNEHRANAHFGRGFAQQQRLIEGDTAGARVTAEDIVADYKAARSIDAATFGNSVDNNIGLMLHALGRDREAIEYLRAAVARPDADRLSLINAAATYEALEQPDSAALLYARVLRADSTYTDALRGLLRVQIQSAAPATVLVTMTRWRADSTNAIAVVGAIPDLLQKQNPALMPTEKESALIMLGASLPVARVCAAAFNSTLRDRLRKSADGDRSSAMMAALLHAYARPKGLYVPAPEASSWQASGMSDPDRRGAAWSALQRWLGDCYNQTDQPDIAASYYEAALGDNLYREYVDRGAMLPLMLIYSSRSDAASKQKANSLMNAMFDAKALAYSTRNLELIREFHMTLGTIYAARNEWSGPGARNAEFQIEALRRVSKDLEGRTGKPVLVPPELLEKLAVRYQETGKANRAVEVKNEVRRDYIKRGKPVDADSVVARIDRRQSALAVAPAPASAQPVTPSAAAAATPARPSPSSPTQAAASTVVRPRWTQLRGTVEANGIPMHDAVVTLIVDGQSRRVALGEKGMIADSIPAAAKSVSIRVSAKGYKVFQQVVTPGQSLRIRLQPN
jgi:Tfp pilus assembly protein PilF